ncbi:MAG: universal stress protein [Atopobiaceae bacterium]|jgi:nucleotide-binding universal stress UspA family protein|nr:universal stress protein [Atopobiaceae bacterium]
MATTYQNLGYNKVFVALDGSEQQAEVLDRAIIVAANNNAELYIGHVIDSTALETAGSYPTSLLSSLEAAFRDSIAEQVLKAEHEPQIKKVKLIIKAGRIRETLKDEMLDAIEPDLVICGARGLSTIKYALLGSISTFLVRSSKVDTLVVK